ncbi:MAG: CBS domain-containing protein [Desulfobacteraceae bacterium]|nr:CBS domain-containing protein [Desulfobacteraceae bacterium]MBC2755538.1 CBS domain-containing protein [Desulfobacteraceae bacterium]
MEKYLIKDLMVPISEYATVSEGATLFEAYLALEKAQEEYDHNKYRHRAILILDKNNRVIGKVGQLDVLRALEPKNEQFEMFEDISKFKFSSHFIMSLREQYLMQDEPLIDICKKTAQIKVEDLMRTPTKGEYVEEDTSLNIAIHQLVRGSHMALLVVRKNEIVGILRLTDVFAAIFHTMKECGLDIDSDIDKNIDKET